VALIEREPLTPAQVRGFWAAWAGWTLDGMDSFIFALVLAAALGELLPRSGLDGSPSSVVFAGSVLFAVFLAGWGTSLVWGPIADRLFFLGLFGGNFAMYNLWLPEQYPTAIRATAFAFVPSVGRFIGASDLMQRISEIVVQLCVVRIKGRGLAIACQRLFRLAQCRQYVGQCMMEARIIRIDGDGTRYRARCLVLAPAAAQNHTGQI